MKKKVTDGLTDAAGIIGACSVSYGCYLIYPPAGFIVAGVLVMVGSFLRQQATP
jgi:hypothetical protein